MVFTGYYGEKISYNFKGNFKFTIEITIILCYNMCKYGGVMSKQLAKIISICILAVLLPLAVVATAIAVTQAKDVTISVLQAGVDASQSGTSSEVEIIINGETQAEDSVTVRKNSSLTVQFTGTGYFFKGWLENGETDYVSTKETFKLVASSNKTLTAVRDVQKYNISYSGENADGSAIALAKDDDMEYNTVLPSLSNGGAKVFAGWAVKGAQSVIPVFKANFDAYVANGELEKTQNTEVELEPIWKQNTNYTVYFNVNDKSATNSFSMTYSATAGFDAYTLTRDGYTFVGLSIEGSDKVYAFDATEKDYLCNGEKLSDALVRANTTELYANWECDYQTIVFNFEAVKDLHTALYTDKGQGLEIVKEDGLEVEIADANNINLDDNFFNYFMGAYTNITTQDGSDCEFTGTIRVNIAGTSTSYVLDCFMDDTFTNVEYDEITFRNVYDRLIDALGSNFDKVARLNVYFIYDIA